MTRERLGKFPDSADVFSEMESLGRNYFWKLSEMETNSEFFLTETTMVRLLFIGNFPKRIQVFSRNRKRKITHIQLISFNLLYSKCLDL